MFMNSALKTTVTGTTTVTGLTTSTAYSFYVVKMLLEILRLQVM
jgi:hypothetical protein